jgi:hypothetical protein
MHVTRCVVRYPQSGRNSTPGLPMTILVVIIMVITAIEGWSLTDVTALATAVAVMGAPATRPRLAAPPTGR